MAVQFRAGTNDATSVVEDVKEYENLPIPEGATVLDIGGHIGLFALQAYARGARRVFSVEPEADNAKLHRANLAEHPQHILIEAAVVGNQYTGPTIPLYVNSGRNKAFHTLWPTKGREKREVATIGFSRLLLLAAPHVLKIDCEGAEYAFDYRNTLVCVTNLAVEWHFLPEQQHRRVACERAILALGFKQIWQSPERSYRMVVYTR
jgi:FkbM family methyltransferase